MLILYTVVSQRIDEDSKITEERELAGSYVPAEMFSLCDELNKELTGNDYKIFVKAEENRTDGVSIFSQKPLTIN